MKMGKPTHKHTWDKDPNDKTVTIIHCTTCNKVSLKGQTPFRKHKKRFSQYNPNGCFGKNKSQYFDGVKIAEDIKKQAETNARVNEFLKPGRDEMKKGQPV